ncbi:PAS domain S-box protein [Nocardia sp. NPDC057227]|uniref:PAS domain S-box protein n=1 Tax=Nocardia sp. NPDC057227 TaxID=3346056 RepID=UPI0036407E04
MTNSVDGPFRLDHEELLARLADVIYAVDLRGRFCYVNPAGADLFGWAAESLRGEHFSTVVAPDALEATIERFRQGLADPTRHPYFETRILRPDGQIREMEIHAGSVYRDGRVIGRQGVGRDITELKQLQSELADKTSRLTLLEDQQRAAMDLYRRFSLMAGRISTHPDQAERALEAIEQVMQKSIVRAVGLDEHDLPIIQLVAEGYSNQDIAEQVHLSIHTVKDRVSRIITKLDARSRAGVALRAADAGLLSPPPI